MAWYGNKRYNRYGGYNRYSYNNYGYRRNRNFLDMFDERNDYSDVDNEKKYPVYKIICENDKYFGFINAIPKPEYRNEESFKKIDEEFYQLTQLRITSVKCIEKDGLCKFLFKNKLPLYECKKTDEEQLLSLGSRNKTILYICFTTDYTTYAPDEIKKIMNNFFIKYFYDYTEQIPIIDYSEFGFFEGVPQKNDPMDKRYKLLKEKHHSKYHLEKAQTSDTPIEQIFRKALTDNGIKFEEQVDFNIDGKKFSTPDFVLREYKIIIYCDGAEYHNDPKRIAMDKQQDRALQIAGYFPLRFTGSEIVNNVSDCISQVKELIKRL